MSTAIVSGIFSGGLFAIIALGLSLVFGVMRMVNLAHGGLVLLGGYGAYWATENTGRDPLLSLLVVCPLMFALGYLTQRLLLTRLLLRGSELPLVATFGLLLLAQGALTLVFSGDPVSIDASYASTGVSILGVQVRVIDVIGLALAIVLVLGSAAILRWTRLGTAIRAASADPQTAANVGINVDHVYGLTFGFAAALAAVAGVVIAVGLSLTPTSGLVYLTIGFTVVVLGGIGSVVGTLAGGISIGLAQSLGGSAFGPQYQMLTVYVVFLVMLAVRPQGLFGKVVV